MLKCKTDVRTTILKKMQNQEMAKRLKELKQQIFSCKLVLIKRLMMEIVDRWFTTELTIDDVIKYSKIVQDDTVFYKE